MVYIYIVISPNYYRNNLNQCIMIKSLQSFENPVRKKLFISTFVLAIVVMLVINAIVLLIHILEMNNNPAFEVITFTFRDSSYIINNEKMGISLGYNLLGIIIVWLIMLYHSVKTIYNVNFFLDNFNDYY